MKTKTELDPTVAEIADTAKALLRTVNHLPAWGRNGTGLGFERPLFRTTGFDDDADALRSVAVGLADLLGRLEDVVSEFRVYADSNKATEDELAGLRRDLAAVRRVFGTEAPA